MAPVAHSFLILLDDCGQTDCASALPNHQSQHHHCHHLRRRRRRRHRRPHHQKALVLKAAASRRSHCHMLCLSGVLRFVLTRDDEFLSSV